MKRLIILSSLLMALSSFGQSYNYKSVTLTNVTSPSAINMLGSNSIVDQITVVAGATNITVNFFDALVPNSATNVTPAYTSYSTIASNFTSLTTNSAMIGRTDVSPIITTNTYTGIAVVATVNAISYGSNILFTAVAPANSVVTYPCNIRALRFLNVAADQSGSVTVRYRAF